MENSKKSCEGKATQDEKMVSVEKKTRWWKWSWQVCNARNPRQYYCSFDADCKSDCKAKPVKPWLRCSCGSWLVVSWQTICLVLYLDVSLSLRVGQEVRRGVLNFLWKHHPRPLEACGWKSATDRAFSICVQPSPEAFLLRGFWYFCWFDVPVFNLGFRYVTWLVSGMLCRWRPGIPTYKRAGSHFQRFGLQASLLPFKFLFQDISNLANAVSHGKSQVFCPSDEQCHPPGNCQNCVDRTYGFSW